MTYIVFVCIDDSCIATFTCLFSETKFCDYSWT